MMTIDLVLPSLYAPDLLSTAVDNGETDINSDIDFYLNVDLHIEKINQSIEAREKIAREDVYWTFMAGHALSRLKAANAHGGYGNWENFVTKTMNYKSPREAQIDMQIWRFWSPHLRSIAGHTQETEHDWHQWSGELVDALDGVSISDIRSFTTATKSALLRAAEMDMPDYAVELLMKYMQNHEGYASIRNVENIAKAALAINELGRDARGIAAFLVTEQGITNPEVLSMVAQQADSEMLDEISRSGALSVPNPDGNVAQIEAKNLTPTDIRLAINDMDFEEHVRNSQGRAATITDEKRYRHYETEMVVTHDNVDEIIRILQSLSQEKPCRVVIWSEQ